MSLQLYSVCKANRNKCTSHPQIQRTDFTNSVALQALLQHLHGTFVEVKCHEDIEDKIILEKLQARLKSHCVDNVTVCDCHSDSRVGQVS
jgi:hypothetical protein